jgi:hypothetical protein
MKKHYIDSNLSLQQLISNLSSEAYSVWIDDIENVYFEHKTRKDVIVKPIAVEINNNELKSMHDHFLFTNPDITVENIEYIVYDYVVAIIDDNDMQENESEQGKINILIVSLTELMVLQEKSEFTDNDKNWSIFEYVSDTWEPSIINEVENMDLPID